MRNNNQLLKKGMILNDFLNFIFLKGDKILAF